MNTLIPLIASACLSIICGYIYISSIISGASRPSFPAQVVFMMALCASLASGYASGGTLAMVPATLNLTSIVLTIAIMLIRRTGHFKFSRFDIFGIVVITLSLIAWSLTSEPFIALLAATIVDATGVVMVLAKIMHDKDSESVPAWSFACLAYLIPLVFAPSGTITVSSSIYSISNVLLCGLVAGMTLLQRHKIRSLNTVVK